MTLKINVSGDMKDAARFADAMTRQQIPFATALGLNRTGQKVVQREKDTMRDNLDRPTPTTVKAVRMKASSKSRLTAIVFILPAISKFLKYQIEGGVRAPRGRVEAVPWRITLNQYGNIPGRRTGKLAKLLTRPDTFSAVRGGVSGIWQRGAGGFLKLLVAYERRAKYQIRWPFYSIAEREAIKVWPGEFAKAIKFAMRTARRKSKTR